MQRDHAGFVDLGQQGLKLAAARLQWKAAGLEVFDLHRAFHTHQLSAFDLTFDGREFLLHRSLRRQRRLPAGVVGLAQAHDGVSMACGVSSLARMPARTRASMVLAAMIMVLVQVPRSRAALQANFWPFSVMPDLQVAHFIRPDSRRLG